MGNDICEPCFFQNIDGLRVDDFLLGSTKPKLLQQLVKYSGCSSFVGVKYDNPAASDDDSGFHDINAMVATMIYTQTASKQG
jgi:hypothetical protein